MNYDNQFDMLGEQQMFMSGFGGACVMLDDSEIQLVETPTVQIKSTQDQIFQLAHTIDLLNHIWLEEPDIQREIDPDDWRRFMDAVYQGLLELQTESVRLE